MPAPLLRRTSPLMLALALAACGTLPHRAEIAAAVDDIDEARLAAHVAALSDIGPRPIEDTGATARAVAWLRGELEGLGLTVTEEPVRPLLLPGRMVANVRRLDADPESEPEQIEIPNAFRHYGARPLRGQTARLRGEGWEVITYSGLAGPAPGDIVAPNLLAEIPGRSGRAGVFELSAHYDSVPGSPGADDNASGVAALLEIARVLVAHPPERTVRLCFFAGEEASLLGGKVHVDELTARDEPVIGLLNLDSVGHASREPDSQLAPVRIPLVTWMPSTGDFVAVIGDWNSGSLGNLFEAAARTYVPDLPFYSANRIGGWFADGRRSDHAPYWDAGIPAVFLTDTGEFRDDTYHMPDDTIARLDFTFLRRVTQATTAATLEATRR